MSVDTRTPRTPSGDRASGFGTPAPDDTPALSMVKVPSDPAQVVVNHASFRVELGASTRRARSAAVARHVSAMQGAARPAGRPGEARRRPVVWSGRSAPDDTGAHRLLQAVRAGGVRHGEEPAGDAGATQVIPRVDAFSGDGDGGHEDTDATVRTPVVGGQRTPDSAAGTRLLPQMRRVGSAYEEDAYEDGSYGASGHDASRTDGHGGYGGYDEHEDHDGYGDGTAEDAEDEAADRTGPSGADVRHAYYPGRRMNLGVVLLPLRVFLGFISIYAGMGKLCDPVYFDGGERGSMVKWLNSLHPWEAAEPLRQFALAHPVGAGLVIAFLQVLVGVLTVLGLWQRVAAVVGVGLSAALIVTVSWKTVPVYDAPDIIYLAAWSPLVIAGAPVYSIDGRLAAGAWRRLGPRSDIWDLRRYVLRRGALITAVVTGLTLLIGSLLGGAVRDADRVVVPGPGEAPHNEQPGSPLPETPGKRQRKADPSASAGAPTQGATSSPSHSATASDASRTAGTVNGGRPSQTQGTAGQAPPRNQAPAQQAPSTSAGPSTAGGAGGAESTTSGGAGSTGGSGSGGSNGSGGSGRLVGGLLG
ncbi:DoxX family protein [Streptomyces sp. C1-2]|uniref:DoxX family protein n=1 Tax=Streptomyces sp. C1-2 TaxID=2720022 RepID=UPI0014323814|nr:DoxX family protein [Streptomyces sp. C1-2]NJP72969.1 DoxX family membrane protein [Streptomyces sp. C1-2]